MRLLPNRKRGDNIVIINTYSWRQLINERKHDFLTIIYKDLDTDIKYKYEVEDPDYTFYICNEDQRTSYPRIFIEKEKVHPVTVKYKDLEKEIAKQTGLKDFYYNNITSGNSRENKKLHTHPDVFNSDMNIEDYTMQEFSKTFKNEPGPISKAFFDIEVDGINALSDFPEPGECPINAVSLILQDQKIIFVFLLRNPANKLIAEFEKSVQDGYIYHELTEFIINAVGGPEMASKYNINFTFKFLFYDPEDEINLIKDLFVAINTYKPDFALAWNMAFDIPYIIARIQKLGYNPAEIMSSPDFENKIAMYYVDEINKSDFAERGDFARIASYTAFLDQMIHFASRRKGQNKFHSFSLDFIGEKIAKVKKLDYKHITTNLAELPYKNYKIFVFYNIMDTIVQYCIEYNTGDINYVYTKSIINNTRYCKCHRQTVYLTNRISKDIYNNGFIIGNNCNKFNPKPATKFSGAFVADPEQLSPKYMIHLFAQAILCLDNLDDFDYKSLYPSLLREFNIAPNTQIGRIIIPGLEFNRFQMARANNCVQGAFVEDMQSQVWLEVGTRWFNLPNFTQLVRNTKKFFTEKANPIRCLRAYAGNGKIEPISFDEPNRYQSPIEFFDTEGNGNTITDVYIDMPTIKYIEERLMQNAIKCITQQY